MAPSKKIKKKLWATHELINMNHTLLPMSHTIWAPPIRAGRRCWQTLLDIEVFMQPMRRPSMHSWGVQFFFFLSGVWGGIFWGAFFFSPLFPMCSHHVPMGFPKMFPIAPQFYPIRFCCSTPIYINWKGRPLSHWVAHCSYFATPGQKRCFYWGVPNVQKNLVTCHPCEMSTWTSPPKL